MPGSKQINIYLFCVLRIFSYLCAVVYIQIQNIYIMRIAFWGVACLVAGTLKAQDGPTMGWSSWNTYQLNINEALICRQADAMVSKGLKNVGYDHINIDDGFYAGRDKETGELIIHPDRFPNGLKPVADYVHSKGLKAGIYSDAGANSCSHFWGNDPNGEGIGFYGHDQHDADYYFNQCGFDFIKVDFCGGDGPQNKQNLVLDPQERYTAISEAIKATGRTDVRMNVCRWDFPGPWVGNVAFSWRTTHDISDAWWSVRNILTENLYLSAYSSKGHYNDMDMLEVGRSMTAEEDKTHFGMWCIMNSPLLIGCDLTSIKSETLSLIRNTELIALNQDTLYQQAYIVGLVNDCHILVKDVERLCGTKRAFAIYNPTDEDRRVTVRFDDLCLAGKVTLRDVFARRKVGEFSEKYDVSVPAHGTRIFVAEAEQRTERVRYEAETAFISDYQELKNNQSEGTGIYQTAAFCSSGYKVGWLGNREENDLVWRDVYSENGGKYTMTVAFMSGDSRNIRVDVNGTRVKTLSVTSGDWSTVATSSLEIELQKGRNTVRLSNASGWMPDIDYIDLVSNIPSSIGQVSTTASPISAQAYDVSGRPATNRTQLRVQQRRKILAR